MTFIARLKILVNDFRCLVVASVVAPAGVVYFYFCFSCKKIFKNLLKVFSFYCVHFEKST